MSLRSRLEPYTNLNALKALDHQDRKQLSMDIRELMTANVFWRCLAFGFLVGGLSTIGALVGVMLHGR